jgi:hypothetical protein
MPIRLGPLGLSPTLTVANFGIDSNIFNSSTDPKSDFTATVTPRLQARLRAGRMLLSGSAATGFVYYHEFDDERSIDYATDGRADIDLGWFRPYASAALLETRDRLNVELDARAPRIQVALAAGARFLPSTRIGLVFDMRRSGVEFAEDSVFEGVPLSRTLNSETSIVEAGVEFYLTPLTTLSMTASEQLDRFDHSPQRDADAFRIMSRLRMEAPAIVQGTIAVGYRRFNPISPALPDYSGLVAEGSIAHTFGERTKLDLTVARDIHYSYEIAEPYYLTTGFRVTLTERLLEPVDVRGFAGRDRLDYRAVQGPADAVPAARSDRVDAVGAGVGYRFQPNLRVGVDVEYARRLSDRADRRYDRTRVFASMAYGF